MKKFLALFIVTLLLPAQVFAANGEALLKYAPENSKVVFGVDVAKIKGTKLFKKGIAYLKKNAPAKSALAFALNNGVINIEKNVKSVLVASKAPKGMNPNNISPKDSVIIIDGKFDLKKITALLSRKNKKVTSVISPSGFTILKFDKMELGLLSESTLILASNKNAALVWKTAEGKSASVETAKGIKGILANTNLKQGVWAIAALKGSPKLKGTSISASLKSGLAVIAKTMMTKPEYATEAKADLEQMVKSQGGMAKMFGAGELVDNLKVKIEKKNTVRIQTRISNAAVSKLLVQLESMAKAQMKNKKGKKPKAMPKRKKGSSADFN